MINKNINMNGGEIDDNVEDSNEPKMNRFHYSYKFDCIKKDNFYKNTNDK